MSAQNLKQLTRKVWEEVLPSGDFAAVRALIHPDCVSHDLPPGMPQGPEGVVRTIAMLHDAFAEHRYEVHRVVGEDDTVVIDATLHGRHTGAFFGIPQPGAPSRCARSTSSATSTASRPRRGRCRIGSGCSSSWGSCLRVRLASRLRSVDAQVSGSRRLVGARLGVKKLIGPLRLVRCGA